MKYKTSEKKIYVTTDYDIFKTLTGNRDVKNGRVVKTIESIQEFGWLTEPILVNENLEVIDGQGRLEALRRLEMPVEFIIEKGIGIKECQGLNHYQKNWSTMDYIDSFIAGGNENYIWLKSMISKYKRLTNNVVLSVASSGGRSASIGTSDYFVALENGTFKVPEKARIEAEDAMFYLSRFTETAAYLGGRKDKLYSAIMFLYLLDGVDRERLCKTINNGRYDGMVASSTIEGYLQQFEILYNKGLAKAKRIDMIHEYKIA